MSLLPQGMEGEKEIPAEAVIVAFGFRPSPPAWLSEMEVALHDDGRVRVDVGLTFRYVAGQVVVVRVRPGSTAETAGSRRAMNP